MTPAAASPMKAAKTKPVVQRFGGNFTGAFADCAVLFPLLLGLAWQTGASVAVMLATTGAAYLATGWLFRLPIPVQPLKSLAIMAISVGASAAELRVAGLALGLIYLSISFFDVNRLAARVPVVLVRGFQLALGVLLMITAIGLLNGSSKEVALLVVLALGVLGLTRLSGLPILGVLALGGLIWGIFRGDASGTVAVEHGLRPVIVALMVLPQIALTLTNSVLGTERTAHDYFGERAARVTPRRLLQSIGIGNLLVGSLGGMPYCHGSGGITAHYRGGSRSWHSNAIIGTVLLLLAGGLVLTDGGLPAYPPMLQALLLGLIGVYHIQLCTPSWRQPGNRIVLLAMGITALATTNMLAVLVAGALVLALSRVLNQTGPDGV